MKLPNFIKNQGLIKQIAIYGLIFTCFMAFLTQNSCAQDSESHSNKIQLAQAPILKTSITKEQNFTPRNNYHSEQYKEKLKEKEFFANIRLPASNKPQEFPYYENESKDASISVGNTSTGFLVNGKALPVPSLHYRVLPTQYERSIRFGTQELIELLEFSAKKMVKAYPNSVLFLGNFSQQNGGDIPYSVSHNTGRDADIAFYMISDPSLPAIPQNLCHFRRNLHSKEDNGLRKFDTEKNARFIKYTLSHPSIKVQFIFMAKHLRRAVMNYYRENGETDEFITLANNVLQEQAAHDDHMHLRIYCAKKDICGGCVDRSVIHEGIEDPALIREKCIENTYSKLKSKKSSAPDRASALRRIALLEPQITDPDIVWKSLKSTHPELRTAAAEIAPKLHEPSTPLSQALQKETHPEVRCAILQSLAKMTDSTAYAALVDALPNDYALHCKDGKTAIAIITDSLKYSSRWDAFQAIFAQYTKELTPDTEIQLQTALELIANLSLAKIESKEEKIQHFKNWMEKWQGKRSSEWILHGFKSANYPLPSLDNKAIPLLLDALEGDYPIAQNAQLQLLKIAYQKRDCLNWAQQDVRWFWTRYFKKRQKKYKIDLSDRDERGNKL